MIRRTSEIPKSNSDTAKNIGFMSALVIAIESMQKVGNSQHSLVNMVKIKNNAKKLIALKRIS